MAKFDDMKKAGIEALNSPEGLAPRIDMDEAAKGVPLSKVTAGHGTKHIKRVADSAVIDGHPSDHGVNPYSLIHRAARHIRDTNSDRDR